MGTTSQARPQSVKSHVKSQASQAKASGSSASDIAGSIGGLDGTRNKTASLKTSAKALKRVQSVTPVHSRSPAIFQTTLKNRISCTGVGLHSGKTIHMCMRPAEANTGILFKRTDVEGKSQFVAAQFDKVSDTMLGTTIQNADGVEVATVEHLMAAFAGCQVDNAVIELDGPEIPVMDGSSAPYVFLIECADTVELSVPRRAIKVLKTKRIERDDAFVQLSPADSFELNVNIDFNSPAISRQTYQMQLTPHTFKFELSRARTFGFLEQVEYMQKNGRALGGSLDNSIVIDGDKILNDDGLRYADEFVRHKMLDAIGDLYLAGAPLLARFDGEKCGHGLNNQLLRELLADKQAWTYVYLKGQEDEAPDQAGQADVYPLELAQTA